MRSEQCADFFSDLKEKGFGPQTPEFAKVTNTLANKFMNRFNTKVISHVHQVVLDEFVAPANRKFIHLMESQPSLAGHGDSQARVAHGPSGIPLQTLLAQ